MATATWLSGKQVVLSVASSGSFDIALREYLHTCPPHIVGDLQYLTELGLRVAPRRLPLGRAYHQSALHFAIELGNAVGNGRSTISVALFRLAVNKGNET
eukprot:6486821-Amphidinium_carterae.1